MSIKSLLQLILLLLIFVVIGGIYFLYFYSGPLKNENIVNNSLNEISDKGIKQGELLDHDVLQEVNTNKNKKLIHDKNNKIVNKELNKKGLNDAVPLMRIHPHVRKILKSSEIGIINEPVNLGEFWVIIRLDEIIQAEFNEKMKETLSKELFEIFLERLTQEIIDEIKKEKYQGKFN